MARWQPHPFVGGAYTDDATPWSAQDCVNYIPVMAERPGTRSPGMLRQAPGCRLFTNDGVASPVRGLHSAEGLLVAVKGQTFYSYDSEGVATSLGTIPGVKRCSIAHNQITSGNQIAIANGSSGYVYNTVTGVLAQITDEGFPGAKVFDFVDQYIVGVEPLGRYWFWSDLAAATDYNTLDRAEAETAPDKIVTLIATHGEVFVLGERTSEFFYNTGGATGTFQRRDAGMEVGCGAQHSVVRLDNSVVWLGHDGSVYRLNGYQPQRISTHAVEQAIARCNWADAYAYTFEDGGHKIYYLTFTDGQTFGFDMATGMWHRRKSYGLDFWRMSHLVRWGRAWVGGDYTNGSLYILDWRRNDEAGEPLERINTLAPLHDNGNRLIVNALKVEVDAGKTRDSWPTAYEPAALSISGDLPDGSIGDSGTYQYTVTGGVPARVVSILSGSLPPGATMNSSGLVTYTYTTSGSYSWVVQVVDALGSVATVADTASVQSMEWIGSSLGGTSNDIVPSPDGADWTGTGWTVPNYNDGFLLRRSLDGAVVAYNAIVLSYKFGVSFDNGATFSMYDTVGMNGSAHIVGWSGGYWHCSSTSNATRVSDAGVQTSVASTTGFNTMCIANERIIGFKSLRIWHADETGDNWTDVLDMPFTSLVTTFRAKARGSTVCMAAYADLGATLDLHVIWSDDNGDSFSDTTPMSMADPTPSTAPCVWHDEVIGLWAVTLHNRVVFGPTPGALEEAAYTFPSAVNDIGSDGEKFVFACTGHIVTTSDFVTFTQVHAAGAKSVLAYPGAPA